MENKGKTAKDLNERELNRVIEMAWEDRTTFDAIKYQYNLIKKDVITIMRLQMKPSSFRLWRKRVQERKTKHLKLRGNEIGRFKCSRQHSISNK